MFFGLFAAAALLALCIPGIASAHEVYVLSPETVQQAIATPPFSEWEVILANVDQFLLWGFIAALVIFVVFFVSISRAVETRLDPLLAKLPPYAPAICRVTIGLSFLCAAYFSALFGPELPLDTVFGAQARLAEIVLAIIGAMLVLGLYARAAALIGMVLFACYAAVYGTYLFTYTNYAGELLVLAVLGAHTVAIHDKHTDIRRAPHWAVVLKERITPYMIPLLRISFGFSLIYASVYAKVLHNNLALAVATQYPDLVTFFGFEPHFLVLGAAIIEILIGLFFVLGIEIRFTALFLLFWLSLSLWYFGEVVWPHLILIGIPIAFICYGYDKYSLEGIFFKRDGREPVL